MTDDIDVLDTTNEKNNLLDTYFELQESYEKKFGKERTIVFMEIGAFYESYATDDKGHDLRKLASLSDSTAGVNWTCTKKNGNKDVSDSNPYLLGFNSISKDIFLNFMMEHNYTVIMFKQTGAKIRGKKMKRVLEGIYTPSTYLSNINSKVENKYGCCIYLFIKNQMIGAGISLLDVTTGKNIIHESYSNEGDNYYALDEVKKIISFFIPKEIYICCKENVDNYIKYLELDPATFRYYDMTGEEFPDDIYKTNYQNNHLAKIFENKNKISMLEYLGIERNIYGTISYIILLNFIYSREPLLLENINKPELYSNGKQLVLGNDVIEQLNVFPKEKKQSLYDIITKTSTVIGKRFLKNALLNPITDVEELNKRYKLISSLKKFIEPIGQSLKQIGDLEKYHRLIALGKIQPKQFAQLHTYYEAVSNIFEICNDNKHLQTLITNNIYEEFTAFISEYQKEFNIDEMKKYTLTDIESSFFNSHPTFDSVQKKMHSLEKKINNIVKHISGLVATDGKKNIALEYNSINRHYIKITKKRSEILKKNIKKDTIVNWDKVEFVDTSLKNKDKGSGNYKLIIPELYEASLELDELKLSIGTLVRDTYLETLKKYHRKYGKCLHSVVQSIAYIDFLLSGAKCVEEYNYVKPEIVVEENSYIKATGLRHPIIERINTKTEYVPHNINLGGDIKGLLIYGLNSSGKSSIQKEVGLSIILAQIGYYVPASQFIYSPYNALYARINGNDDILKGLSSFDLEMFELNAILQRVNENGKNTLVIGDEVCRGTEIVSAIAIVSTTLLTLLEKECSFIFTSHIHEIAKMPEIMNCSKIKICHLHVTLDKKLDCLIFNRKLVDGSGPETYGLLVAKYRIYDKIFIEKAESLKKKYLGESTLVSSTKKSRYNSSVYIENCQICGRRPIKTPELEEYLDTHHINFQKDCDCRGFIESKKYLHKNHESNLAILCKKCHQNVHHGKIIIKGYLDTTNGSIINYEYKNSF